MLEQGPQEIRTGLPSCNPGLDKKKKKKKGKGSPARSPEALALPSSKRQADRHPAWPKPPHWLERLRWTRDTGLPRSPAGTNPPGRGKPGSRRQGAQLTNKGGLLVSVCLCQTERHQPGAWPTGQQRRPSHHFCPNKRPGRVRAAPRTRGDGRTSSAEGEQIYFRSRPRTLGSPERLRRDTLRFSFFCRFLRVVANVGCCLLIALRCYMGVRFH